MRRMNQTEFNQIKRLIEFQGNKKRWGFNLVKVTKRSGNVLSAVKKANTFEEYKEIASKIYRAKKGEEVKEEPKTNGHTPTVGSLLLSSIEALVKQQMQTNELLKELVQMKKDSIEFSKKKAEQRQWFWNQNSR